MITAQAPLTAVRQMERLARDGFRGIEIGTHIAGTPLGDPSLWPIYEAAEALNLAVFVHSLHPAGCDRMGIVEPLSSAAAFPLEIAMAAVALVTGGVVERFPRLRVLLSHGGGAFAALLPRLAKAWSVSKPVRDAIVAEPRSYARAFWYDSNVYDTGLLAELVARVGADRVVIGSDYPFAMRQDDPVAFVNGFSKGFAHDSCHAAFRLLHGQ